MSLVIFDDKNIDEIDEERKVFTLQCQRRGCEIYCDWIKDFDQEEVITWITSIANHYKKVLGSKLKHFVMAHVIGAMGQGHHIQAYLEFYKTERNVSKVRDKYR